MASSREIIAKLAKAGFREVRPKGSQKVFRHPDTNRMVVMKHPSKDYPPGTLSSMERQSGIKLT